MATPAGREPDRDDFDNAEPVVGSPGRVRWALGLVVGTVFGIYFAGSLPAIVIFGGAAVLAVHARTADQALPGAALGLGLVTTFIVGLVQRAQPNGLPLPVWAIEVVGIATLVGGLAGTAVVFRRHGDVRE